MLKLRTTSSWLKLAFGALTSLTIVVGAFGLRGASELSGHLTVVTDDHIPALGALNEARTAFQACRVASISALSAIEQGKFERLPKLRAEREEAVKALRAGLKKWASFSMAPAEKELWSVLEPGVEYYIAENGKAWEAYEAHDVPRAEKIREGYQAEANRRFVEPLQKLLAQDIATMLDESKAAHDVVSRTGVVMWSAMVIAVLLAVALGWFISRRITGSIRHLVDESTRLGEAVDAGRLDLRAEEAAATEEFRPVLASLNRTMDAFVTPFKATAQAVEQIGRGEIPARISETYRGDFNQIKVSLNHCIDAVNALVADASRLAEAGVAGQLSTRADAARHQGDFRKVIEGVNGTLDAVVGPLGAAARCVDQIAQGAIPPRITEEYRGDFDALKRNLNTCTDAIRALVQDSQALAQAGVAGQLSTRADASRHQGDFRRVVEGINQTLDAVVGPLNVAARTIDEIARGRIPPPITEAYRGDFDALKKNLNTCIAALQALVTDTGRLVEAALAGQLASRADASHHQGDFRRVVEGITQTLDAVIAPITEASQVLEALAQRDLTARGTGHYQGDHAAIQAALNATGQSLQAALSQVSTAVEQVSSASTQIASSAQAVASGASQQAASLTETTSSLQMVADMTRQAAGNASQANTLAQVARAAADEGTSAVAQMQGAMQSIKASAEGTSQIIRDINDIAFQTNLLALNAAVEAARAGEAGRGFAVVAEEVRSLALRSKEAATKTEALIRESVRQAGEGAVTAQHVGDKLTEIAGGIGKVTDLVAEIAAASREQTTGLDQVTQALGEMDKVTQQNAASAEESSAAASELSTQSEELTSLVSAFNLGGGRSDRPHAAALPRASARPGPAMRAPAADKRPALTKTNGLPPVAAAERHFPMAEEGALREF